MAPNRFWGENYSANYDYHSHSWPPDTKKKIIKYTEKVFHLNKI